MSALFPDQPNVVFIFSKSGTDTSTKFGGFSKRLKKHGGLQGITAHYCALEDLVFVITDRTHAKIIDARSGLDLSTVSFAYFKSWESMPEEAGAVAQFFEAQGIPYLDALVGQQGVSKLVTHFRLWRADVSVIPTLYARKAENALRFFNEQGLDWLPAVVKSVNGEKGRDNHLIRTLPELEELLTSTPDKQFLLQPYIPNDGDYRIGVYGEQPRFAIKRVGGGESHLNNTSQGGQAEYLAIKEVDSKILSLAAKAAEASLLQAAGVDVIEDAQTKARYVLEVNQGSQIVTGVFVEQKIAAFNEFLNEAIGQRYSKSTAQGKKLRLIGRRTYVSFPELGLEKVIAKVDTGAYSSSLHAVNIRVDSSSEDVSVLRFDVVKADGSLVPCMVQDFKRVSVRSSTGHNQERYLITTRAVIGGKRLRMTITLADRSVMNCPVLLGRKVIRSKFLVNVELSEHNLPEWKY